MVKSMRAKIVIKNDVQEVGLRSIATAILIENGIDKALVKNDKKDRTKLYIILDGDEEVFNHIIEALNVGLRERKEYPQLPEQFTISEWEEINSNPEELPNLSPYASDALQLRQMCKFVGVGDRMAGRMDHMADGMDEMRADMPKNIAKELGPKFDELGEKLEKIAEALKK